MSARAEAIQITADAGHEEIVFREVLVPPRGRGGAFLISSVGHCAFFFLLPYLASVNFFENEPPVKLYVARVASLNLRLTEPIYAPPPPPPARRSRAVESAEKRQSTSTGALNSPEPAPETEPEPVKPAVVARPFELPTPVRPAAETQPTILQPPEPSLGVPVQQLPKVISWTDPALPRPTPKPFITPGRQETPEEKPPELTAPPTLEASARAEAISTINVGQAPSLPRPKLALPPSRTVPLRIPDVPPELKGGEIARGTGDPANLIILGAGGKPRDWVAVPPGSNVPRTVAEGAGAGSGKNGAGAPGSSDAGSRAGRRAAGASGLAGSGAGAGSAGTSAGISVSGAGTAGTPTKATGVITLSAAAPASPRPTPPITRGQKKPGVFDVVVVQTAAVEASFQSFGILKGKPVYTVYLNLGARKAWILQYCLASSAHGSGLSGVVRLNESQPITPPYPLTTVLSELELQPKASYTLIHGFVTAVGRFRNLTLLGKVDQQLTRLIQLLEKWEFRPSMNGNAPAEVEVLLAIPPG